MSDAERLAKAVLLFHRGGPWFDRDRELWSALTGEREATTKVLCDLARRIRATEEANDTYGPEERPDWSQIQRS